MAKPGISIDIPGFGLCKIDAILTDYTGTLSRRGRMVPGVRERLIKLAELTEIHVITSDTFGFAQEELEGIPLTHQRLQGEDHDIQKREYGRRLDLLHSAVLGNGNNDRLLLKAVKETGGLAIAVDNGEGCATDALLNSNLFIVGAVNALDLLVEPKSCKATLRF
jgi:soluble P-type ATPase